MQWQATSAAQTYTDNRQQELRRMANAAKREKKANRFHLPGLLRRAKTPDIRVTAENMTPVSNVR